jgi:hypothetical protein
MMPMRSKGTNKRIKPLVVSEFKAVYK